MFLFRGTWIIIFLGLFFATTLTFADDEDEDDDYDYDYSVGGGEFNYRKVASRGRNLFFTTPAKPWHGELV